MEGLVPVTAKLSKRFYEVLGEDVANELVDWFNQVDATYRSDLRELNELNFARFDAKLEQRAAQLDAKVEQRAAQIEAKLEQRAAQIETKIETGLARLEGGLLARIGQAEGWLARLRFPFARTLIVMMVGNVLVGVWLRPDFRRAAAASRADGKPTWAVVLLIASLGLFVYGTITAYLIARSGSSTESPTSP